MLWTKAFDCFIFWCNFFAVMAVVLLCLMLVIVVAENIEGMLKKLYHYRFNRKSRKPGRY